MARYQIAAVTALALLLVSGTPGAARADDTVAGGYPPLSPNSLYWLDGQHGSGFSLAPAHEAATVPESLAVSRAVIATSMFGTRTRVREVGLKSAIVPASVASVNPFPKLKTGQTYWVVSVLPGSKRLPFRWFFVLVDARSGDVAAFFEGATGEQRLVDVPGERPLRTLPNISVQALAPIYLLDQPSTPARISRARAVQLVGKTGYRSGAQRHGAQLTTALAHVWGTNVFLDIHPAVWVVGRPVYWWNARTRSRSPAYELTLLDAESGTWLEAMCCVPAIRSF